MLFLLPPTNQMPFLTANRSDALHVTEPIRCPSSHLNNSVEATNGSQITNANYHPLNLILSTSTNSLTREGKLQALRHQHPITSTTPQPFYGPFSGTTRVSRCQKRTSGLGRHNDHPDGRHSIWTSNQCPPPPSPIFFYRPDALPAAQPTASKHRRQLAHSD